MSASDEASLREEQERALARGLFADATQHALQLDSATGKPLNLPDSGDAADDEP